MLRSTALLCCALTAVLATTSCSASPSESASDSGASARLPAASSAPTASASPQPPSATPSEEPGSSPEAVAPARIVIVDFAYEIPASVPAGTAVEVVNEDAQAHTVSLAGTDVSVVVQGGATEQFAVPAEPGSYAVACQFHGNMSATLVVV